MKQSAQIAAVAALVLIAACADVESFEPIAADDDFPEVYNSEQQKEAEPMPAAAAAA
ncbi:MAG: hypothetical protein KDA85_17025 [Planctomycetaceae bacterium]|nr:hypothetical protein [Planctomycetaceae bacterium]